MVGGKHHDRSRWRVSGASGSADSWTFDCDITTPHFVAGGGLCNIDLELDVFVRSDARTHVVADQDHFERSIREGWIGAEERRGAEQGLADLLSLVERGTLLEFLQGVCPLRDARDAAVVGIRGRRSQRDLPVQKWWRTRKQDRV